MTEILGKMLKLQDYMNSQIIGQEDLISKMIIALLADGHALVEGAPGLAKTKAIKTLASMIKADYNRIQFTPDLLPSDITGSDIYLSKTGEFVFREGPIFANLVLADEINRAPAKVQSALLEAMAERQISVGGKRYELPKVFMVMAPQNQIENEGTYNLPEAQLDRFLMYIKIDYPNSESEKKILRLVRDEVKGKSAVPNAEISLDEILKARSEAMEVHISEAMEEYLVQLVMATRNPQKVDATLKGMVAYGASPRATIALERCAKIHAWLQGRNFVAPEDVQAIVYDVLRHRIILTFEAQAEGITTDKVITAIVKGVALP